MKKISALSTILLLSLITAAHEFWLQPDKFIYKVGENVKVNFKIGENFIGEPWEMKRERVEKLEIHDANISSDLMPFLKDDPKENLGFPLQNEGTHVLIMQSTNAFIELEAEKFNAYLKEDGLDDAYYQREKSGTLNKPGREMYARYTKLMVQVGEKRDDTFKKVIGLPIEIIPEKNPYAMKVGDLVKFRTLFQGKPLFGVKVMVWNRHDNRTIIQPVYTLQDGTIEARISSKGPWMVSVVKIVPSKDVSADWQSYWGSLVFGIE